MQAIENKELANEYNKTIKRYNECLENEVWPAYNNAVSDMFGNQEWPNFDETAEDNKTKQKIFHYIELAAGLPELDKKIKKLVGEAQERLSDGRMIWDGHARTVFFENY